MTTHNTTRETSAAFDGIRRAWHTAAIESPQGAAPLPHTRSIDGIARTSHNTFASQAQYVVTPQPRAHPTPLQGVRAILGSLDGIRMPQLARSV